MNINTLTSILKDKIKPLANNKEEIVGYFFEDGSIYPCKNVHSSPGDNWLLSDTAYLQKQTLKPFGVYHTHCNDEQSDVFTWEDCVTLQREGLAGFLYNVGTEAIDYWNPNDCLTPYPLKPNSYSINSVECYLNLEWQWARFDCFCLVRAFYRGVFGIEIGDYPRNQPGEVLEFGWDRIRQNIESQSFKEVPPVTHTSTGICC